MKYPAIDDVEEEEKDPEGREEVMPQIDHSGPNRPF